LTSPSIDRQTIEGIEALSLQTYEMLAPEFYTAAHPTSQVFEQIIDRYIAENPPSLKPREYYLDVGSGKSKLSEMGRHRQSNVVMIDISRRMILHSRNLKGEPIVGSAFRLPIRSGTFCGVYSFLGDAFSNSVFFVQVFRVLKQGGEFLLILPAHLWAHTLRMELKIPLDMTLFVSGNSKLFAPSFTFQRQSLESQMSEIGFRIADSRDLFLPADFPKDKIPEHIAIPSRVLNVRPHNLPILSLIRGLK
jgi:SAM-dependent methyltransferase